MTKYNKMEGWVARDKKEVGDSNLYFWNQKPTSKSGWWYGHGNYMRLPKEMFPNLKWEDEPLKAELTIKELQR